MNATVLSDLDHHRKRLEYYLQLKAQQEATLLRASPPTSARKVRKPLKSAKEKVSSIPIEPQLDSLDKWIEIYSQRVRKLETQAVRMGLLTPHQLQSARELQVH